MPFERFTQYKKCGNETSQLRIGKTGLVHVKKQYLNGTETHYDLYYDRKKKQIAINLKGSDRKYIASKGGHKMMALGALISHYKLKAPLDCEVLEKESGYLILKPTEKEVIDI